MKKILNVRNLISLLGVSLLVLPRIAKAAVSIGMGWAGSTGLGTGDLTQTVAGIIQIIIGFLGVVAVVIVLIGGFKWMTAAGNEEKVSEAKKLLGAGVIGLVIILAAYAIASFIISSISQTVD